MHTTDRDDGDADTPTGLARIPAETLFRGRREIVLVHDDTEYRLRVTANNKLLLTK